MINAIFFLVSLLLVGGAIAVSSPKWAINEDSKGGFESLFIFTPALILFACGVLCFYDTIKPISKNPFIQTFGFTVVCIIIWKFIDFLNYINHIRHLAMEMPHE